ncbi:MAG: hypothetical protein ACFFCS_03020 [Candidatus Hodarchaeota archaeon]
MFYPQIPRIHDVLRILIIHDFLFNSPNLERYYKIYEPALKVAWDHEAYNKRKDYYLKLFRDFNGLVREELRAYFKNYNMHGFSVSGSYVCGILVYNKENHPPDPDDVSISNLLKYFKIILLKKVNHEEIPETEMIAYQSLIDKVRKEYEGIKDELTRYEKKNPKIIH